MAVTTEAPPEHLDVLIVGAGLSGVGAGCTIARRFPGRSYALLESRDAIGGTWDLFRYPGIRSDSDMQTLGYKFAPWKAAKAIADGPSILAYVRETAEAYGVTDHVRYGHKVVHAAWSTPDARWTIEVELVETGARKTLTCGYFLICSGYYRYDQGYLPELPGADRFQGTMVHPQHWPEDLDYTDKKVVIIGSGATAVTLLPSMAPDAAHVTQLQRTPSYLAVQPGTDKVAGLLSKYLPDRVAFPLVRWKNAARFIGVYQLSRRRPQVLRHFLRMMTAQQLKGTDFDVDVHFKPPYDPWDQRLCVAPDSDYFKALRSGKASIVTDRIKTITETGIELESGDTLDADVIITATGLNLLLFGGAGMSVDGKELDMREQLAYKGMMLEGVPNMAFAIGYTNASWTLKVDLVFDFVTRVIEHMDKGGFSVSVPVNDDPGMERVPLMDFQAGYVLRSIEFLPEQGTKAPWNLRQNYALDYMTLKRGNVDDGVMRFSAPAPVPEREPDPVAA